MSNIFYTLIAVLVVVKIALLAHFGPVLTPDSLGYADMARILMASTAWLHDADLRSTHVPPLAFRMIGYPAFVAAMMAVAGAAWAYAVVVIQSALSLATAGAALRLGAELGLPARLSALAVAAYATSLQLTLDQCILADSLNASIVILAIVLLLRGAGAGRPLSATNAVAAGGLLALAFLLREIMQVLLTLFLLILAARIMVTATGLRTRTAAAGLLMLLPPLATIEAYRDWNAYRTGERFVTTGAQTAALLALTRAAQHDPALLSADTPLDRTLRNHLHHFTFDEVLDVNAALHRQGYLATAIARMAGAGYIAAWRQHPRAMLSLLDAISENQAKLAVRPVTAVCEIIAWGDNPPCPDYRDLYRKLAADPSRLTITEGVAFIVITIQNALSIALFAAFLIGVPTVAVVGWRRHRGPGDRTVLLLAAWALYCGWDLAYALIHLEDRYLAPLIPLSTFGGLMVLNEMTRLTRQPGSWRPGFPGRLLPGRLVPGRLVPGGPAPGRPGT